MGNDQDTLKVPSFGTSAAHDTARLPADTPELTQQLLKRLSAAIAAEQQARSDPTYEVQGQQEAFFRAYESLRNSLEYTEEHLVMRGAVARFLRRNFRAKQAHVLVTQLIDELIRSGYIENGSLRQATVNGLVETLGSYQALSQHLDLNDGGRYKTFVGIVSAHVQDIVIDNHRAPVVIDFIHNHLLQRFDSQTQQQADIPMYIAVERILLKSDNETITSRLFRRYYGAYLAGSPESVAAHYDDFIQAIQHAARSKDLSRALIFVRKESAAMLVLVDMLDEIGKPETLLKNNSLAAAVRRSAEDLYARSQKRLMRAVVRSIIFLIITKALVGLAFEIPYDLAVHGEIKQLPLLINLAFPPLYLLFISATIRPPDQTNTEIISKQIQAVLNTPETLGVSSSYEYVSSSAGRRIFNALYLLLSGLLLYGLVLILLSLGFNIASMAVFLVYFSSVSFFSYRIANVIRELKVHNRRDNDAMNTFISILTAPFVRTGQWLSARYQGINVFVFVFDFLIEAPLKSIATLYRRWTAFLREKQDETL